MTAASTTPTNIASTGMAPARMSPAGVLETVLYAKDLDAAEDFYRDVLGLVPFAKINGRHLFFRCGEQVLLIFNPDATIIPPPASTLPVPTHGARGAGHICFRASAADLDAWRRHLQAKGIAIEADFKWPTGGGSVYFRDPAGNCLEFAEPRIWGLD
jgi:catechol 2,3-dioxygenase-like lactoylglutathione lyase family enzyme